MRSSALVAAAALSLVSAPALAQSPTGHAFRMPTSRAAAPAPRPTAVQTPQAYVPSAPMAPTYAPAPSVPAYAAPAYPVPTYTAQNPVGGVAGGGRPRGAWSGYATPRAGAPAFGTAPDQEEGFRPTGGGLMIGGGMSFALFYAASALSGAALSTACNAAPELDQLGPQGPTLCGDASMDVAYVPIVGPFMAIGQVGETRLSAWPLDVALATLGLGQMAGVALFATGAGFATSDSAKPAFNVSPYVGRGGAGLGMSGAF